jgi:hypothetical protein
VRVPGYQTEVFVAVVMTQQEKLLIMLRKQADEMSVAVPVLSGNLFFENHNGLPARSTEPFFSVCPSFPTNILIGYPYMRLSTRHISINCNGCDIITVLFVTITGR